MAAIEELVWVYGIEKIVAHQYAFNFSGFAIFPLAHWWGGFYAGWWMIDDQSLALAITIGVGYIGMALAIGIIFYFMFQFVKKKNKQG